MNNVIECKNLFYEYKESNNIVEVIKDLNIEIKEGESISILGKSGSGKSTFLNLIGGLDKPTKGGVLIKNQDLKGLSDDQITSIRGESLGFIYQSHHLLKDFTALENVSMPLCITNQKETRKKAKEILEKVGLGDRLDHYPHELSGGERQRVAIARAIVLEPSCILADEPTGSLDSEAAKNVLDLLLGLVKDKNTSLVMVTHDEEIASKMDKKFQMKQGKLTKIS